jgi:hypothetical protein
MDAASDGHMRAGKIWVPDCVADGLTVRVGGVGNGTYLGIEWMNGRTSISYG